MAKKKVSAEISAYMAQISGKGKGGTARAKNLTAAELSAIAKKGAEARWGKAKKKDGFPTKNEQRIENDRNIRNAMKTNKPKAGR